MSLFNSFKVKKPKGNMFNLSHEKKLSFNMGELIPAYIQDVVPGDRFQVNSEIMLRLAPMLAPIMHRVNVYMHYFFVPNRLLWSSWEDFITGGPAGTTAPTFPTYVINNSNKSYFAEGTLADYLGLPTPAATVTQDLTISKLPFYAYQMIYNEYYRDQNVTAEIDPLSLTVGIFSLLRKRAWEKDYFTSALPWSQRGGDVNLPVEAEIEFVPDYKDVTTVVRDDTDLPSTSASLKTSSGVLEGSGGEDLRILNLKNSTMYDIENVNITINDLRQSIRLQQWLEANARGGARYIEQILSHFGVISSDARLQRPEYLGGGKAPVVISEVLTTAESTNYDPGDMFGHGISVGNTNTFNKFFEEHGYILGILSVLPRTAYYQGVQKHWLKTDKFDFYFPEFANLGEQEVINGEVYWDWSGTATATDIFGYQSRYAEYKYVFDSIHGAFKNSLEYWHLGRKFASQPHLNTSFIESDPSHRVFVVTTDTVDKIYGQIYHDVKAWRPMPKYGIPIL